MKDKIRLLLAGSALAALALAGCASTSSPAAIPGASAPTPVAPAPSGKDVATASTTLGTVVVDSKGMTAYFFDKDTANSGKSACTGACAAMWQAIRSSSTTPSAQGITGKIGTIPAVGGGNQITIGGRPIYTFANDKAAGDVNGQGVGKVWYVVDASGKEIKSGRGSY